ncbi:MAG: fibronectin type III domain-containing protein [Ruminococcus sp.]|nr:fibronectin type III domain-containing protein [Ruminococcus sp.]MCM1381221.1 fibronectin type III domain-containing protein [Muribaculaceae bacterium]MCM1478434.1 fibronectin type III domain-containing protein [Muribaculaceae bacterium]
MKFRKTIIGAILAAVISISAIAPCSVVYAETSKTATTQSAVPTNFKASKTTNSITLKWDEVEGADGYRVYMKNPTTGKYEKYKSVTKNSCKVTGLEKGTKYYFKVSVLTKNGEKYKEKANSKSNGFAFTTKKSDATMATLLNLKQGTSEKTVLNKLGIENYKAYTYADITYDILESDIIFTWKNVDYKATIYLYVKDKKLTGWKIRFRVSRDIDFRDDVYDEMYEYLDKLFGDTYEEDYDLGWINEEKKDCICISTYNQFQRDDYGIYIERMFDFELDY